MAKTDRQTDKGTRWAFTAYEEQWNLFDDIKKIPQVKEWGWQKEVCPETGRQHYQGYLLASSQVRLSHWLKHLKGVHMEIARDWNALKNYCKKAETAVEGTQVAVKNDQEFWSMERSFVELMTHYDDFHSKWTERYMNLREHTSNASKTYARDLYWYCVKAIVREEPWRLSIFAQPHMEKTFIRTYDLYKEPGFRALVLQPETSPSSGPTSVILPDI